MPRVLIAGCGYVGAATAELFHAWGWNVEGWTGSEESAEQLSTTAAYGVRAVDLTDADAVLAAATESDVVIQSASSRGGNSDAYRRIYLDAAKNLAAAFPNARLVFTSSTSVYGQTTGEWVTEDSAAEPSRATGAILRETENFVLSRNGVVARLAGIYGPKRSALLQKFLDGTAVLDPSSGRFVNQVHRDDVAEALFLLAQDASGIYNVSDHHPLTQRQCYEWLAAHLHRPLPPTVASPVERKRGATNKRVSSAKLQALGWSPQFPTFQEAMRRSILPTAGL